MGLKKQLMQGEHFKATLQFAKAGKVDVDFVVEGIGAKTGGGAMPKHGRHEDEVAFAAGAEGGYQPIAFGSQVASPGNANTSTSAINCMTTNGTMPR